MSEILRTLQVVFDRLGPCLTVKADDPFNCITQGLEVDRQCSYCLLHGAMERLQADLAECPEIRL